MTREDLRGDDMARHAAIDAVRSAMATLPRRHAEPVVVRTYYRSGDPAAELAQLASELGADVTMIGDILHGTRTS